MNFLVKLAQLGLAGAAVLFAYLAYGLLSQASTVTGLDPVCIKKAIEDYQTKKAAVVAGTDRQLKDILHEVQSGDDNNRNLQNAWQHVHNAQTKIPSFKEALTNERNFGADIGSSLAGCGYTARDWKPFYAFLGLQIALAILLFIMEVTKARRATPHRRA